jgi:hypothetical protein
MKNSDEAVERALAAMREAEVPEGLEGRIAARLAGRAAVRDVAGVWWRGALSGAAVGMLVVGLVWLGLGRGRSRSGEVAVKERVAAVSPGVVVKEDVRSVPCAGPAGVRVKGNVVRGSEGVRVVATDVEVSHPAPAMGLTAQERELVQLARKGDAKELVSLDPEMRAKAEAQDAAEFQKFFAEPVVDAAPAPKVDNE